MSLGLSAGIIAASTAAVFIRFAQQAGAPSIIIAAGRLLIATLVLAPFVLSNHRSDLKKLDKKEICLAILAGLFLAFHFATWIKSLEYTSVASSVVFVSTTPLWVALLAPAFLHERLEKIAIIGLTIATIGGIVISLGDSCTLHLNLIICPPIKDALRGEALLGDFLALCGAWMAAGYLMVGRKLRTKLPLLPYIFVVYGIAALVLITILLFTKTPLSSLTPSTYIWIVLLALFPQLLGHSIFNWSLKYLPASLVSVALLGEPIASSILAFFIFQESPGWIKLGGSILLLTGIWLSSRGKYS